MVAQAREARGHPVSIACPCERSNKKRFVDI
jgi:hypothetical protein